ncbi:MAG: metalloregulator ArsR/SmtB family transcription factor [Betaproteobacteria bacterium]
MDLDDIFGALSSVPRRQIIAFLSQTALSTTDLAGRFLLSPPAISRHLAVLQRAGLVVSERQGQRVLYRLNRDLLLGALARFASAVDGPLRRDAQAARTPREAI